MKQVLSALDVTTLHPPHAEESEGVQIAKLVFAEGLMKNEFLEKLTLV